MKFLIDTSADVSVIPPATDHNMPVDKNLRLFAANGSAIKTYGMKNLALSLGLRRRFEWQFIEADVKYPILGADFLDRYSILPDIRNRRLIDTYTKLKGNAFVGAVEYCTLSTVDKTTDFSRVVQRYPSLTQTTVRRSCKVAHRVEHVIETKGPPIAAKARRLPPEKLRATKAMFMKMLDNGDIRPSKSPWATPITVRPKKGPEKWRICGNIIAL